LFANDTCADHRQAKETIMNSDPITATPSSVRGEGKVEFGQRWIVLAVLATVIVIDQAVKWWAWRHASDAIINYGGDSLVGATVGAWYAEPVIGALLDLLDFGLLSTAVAILLRRRRSVIVLIPAALIIGGWGSNLLDRLGMHYWTAPGSIRGAVDFIHLGPYYYNVADFFIVGGTSVFVLAVSAFWLAGLAATRPATTGSVPPPTRVRVRARTRVSVFAGAVGLVAAVGIGAANYGGVTAPISSAGAATMRHSA
jgi:lipoprotein signal peptidase